MTPYQITILLHYACSRTDYAGRGEPILQETLDDFVAKQLLDDDLRATVRAKDAPRYLATDRLLCYVDGLKAVPLPIWQIPRDAG